MHKDCKGDSSGTTGKNKSSLMLNQYGEAVYKSIRLQKKIIKIIKINLDFITVSTENTYHPRVFLYFHLLYFQPDCFAVRKTWCFLFHRAKTPVP